MFLVADTFLLTKKEFQKDQLISVYPCKKNDQALRFNLDDLLKISKLQSEAINETYLKVSKNLSYVGNIEYKSYHHILRPYLFSITNIFFDRAIRVLHLHDKLKDKEIHTLEVNRTDKINYLSEIINKSFNNWQFNQEIISLICNSLGITSRNLLEKSQYPEYPSQSKIKNNMFLSGKNEFLMKLKIKIFSFFPNGNTSIPTFGLTYDNFYLKKYGICGPFGPLSDWSQTPKIVCGDADEYLRDISKKNIGLLLDDMMSRLISGYLKKIDKKKLFMISSLFKEVFFKYLPVSIFEYVNINIKNYYDFLSKSKSKYIFGTELGRGHDQGLFVCTAAHELNKIIIGYQHGGHYGYIEDNSSSAQLENDLFDYYATWGWNEIDKHLPQCKTFSLPIPSFSDRSLKKNLSTKKLQNKPDILFLSNKLHRFSQVATSGQSRIDFIDQYKDIIFEFVSACKKRKLHILHKLFDNKTYLLLSDFFNDLKLYGKEYYSIFLGNQKGLTNEILSTAKIIVWDQIGTGTLQCFTSRVPTMVLWKRTYSRESMFAYSHIMELEKVGIIHSSIESLLKEYEVYKKNIAKWNENPKRVKAIDNFCIKFCFTDRNWKEIWRNKFSSCSYINFES